MKLTLTTMVIMAVAGSAFAQSDNWATLTTDWGQTLTIDPVGVAAPSYLGAENEVEPSTFIDETTAPTGEIPEGAFVDEGFYALPQF